MRHCCWIRKYICLAALMVAVNLTYAIDFDITAEAHHPDIDVHGGSFDLDGVYRMFCLKRTRFDVIKYGNHILARPKYVIRPYVELYVQEYRRGATVVVAISYFWSYGNKKLTTTCYKIMGRSCHVISRDDKVRFIGGPILLSLDLNAGRTHPFIAKTRVDSNSAVTCWYILSHILGNRSRRVSSLSRLRYMNEIVLIGTVFNIDKQHRNPEGPPPSLSSHCSKVHVSRAADKISVSIRWGPRLRVYGVFIPPIVMGIFKPDTILDSAYGSAAVQSFSNPISNIKIDIDISSIQNDNPDLVIMANLRRGDWFYTQYYIAPIRNPEYVPVRVKNSKTRCELYQSHDDEIVTHVELFHQVKRDHQYVVINSLVNGGVAGGNINLMHKMKRLYKRDMKAEYSIYFELTHYWLEPYLKMLYNIPISPAYENQSSNDIVMSIL